MTDTNMGSKLHRSDHAIFYSVKSSSHAPRRRHCCELPLSSTEHESDTGERQVACFFKATALFDGEAN